MMFWSLLGTNCVHTNRSMVLRGFNAYNVADGVKDTLTIGHPFNMEKCMCTLEDDPSCLFYTVGYNVEDFCTALRLNPDLPVYLSKAPTTALTVIDDPVFFGPVLLIPVHKTTPANVGFQN